MVNISSPFLIMILSVLPSLALVSAFMVVHARKCPFRYFSLYFTLETSSSPEIKT